MAKAAKKPTEQPAETAGIGHNSGASPAETGALFVLDEIQPAEVFKPEGTSHLIEIVEAEVKAFLETMDPTTEEGRKEIRKFSRRLGSTQTGMDTLKKEFTSARRKEIEDVNNEGKRFVDTLDGFKEQVNAPLEEWQRTENARLDAHKAALEAINALPAQCRGIASELIQAKLDGMPALLEREWEEFNDLAVEASDRVTGELITLLNETKTREEEQAELAKLRKQNEEREAADAAKKAEEENTRLANERATKAAADAETARINTHKQRLQQMGALVDNINTLSAAVIEDRVRSAETLYGSGYDWQEYKDQAQQNCANVVEALNTALPAARQREKDAEDKRVADLAAEQKRIDDAAAAEREKNKAHRAKINNEALTALMEQAKIDKETGVAVLTAIAQGKIPHVKISY